MNKEIKAASVDSRQFHELAMDYRGASVEAAHGKYNALIAHINAWSDERCNQLAASRAMLPVTDGQLTEDEENALLSKVESYSALVNHHGTQVGPEQDAAEWAIKELVNDFIASRLASPVAGWVSVEERLPPDDSLVMVYVPDSQYAKVRFDTWQMQREAPVSFSSETVEIGFGWDEHEFEEITHWMPFPPAPSPLQEQS